MKPDLPPVLKVEFALRMALLDLSIAVDIIAASPFACPVPVGIPPS
jgi:hypothetical protein